MPNEELIHRGYYINSKIQGQKFGQYEILEIGGTNVGELEKVGLVSAIPPSITFPFKYYTLPKRLKNAKPDTVVIKRVGVALSFIANKENKRPTEFNSTKKRETAFEQALFCGAVLNNRVAVVTDGTQFFYIDVQKSLNDQKLVFLNDI